MTVIDTTSRSTKEKISEIGLISADSHVNEPRDLWSSNLPPSLRSQAMQGIESGEDGSWKVVFEGQHVFKRDMASEADRLAVLDPAKRFDVLRAEGIVAESIFPTIGLYVWMLDDPKGGQASCHVYNDWIYDTLQRKSGRFCCAGLIPTWEPEQASAEVERIAEMGLRAIMLPSHTEVAWNHRVWDPHVGRDRRDRAAGRDAPGHRVRHDLVPRPRCDRRQPRLDRDDRAARRHAARDVGRAGASPESARGVRRVQHRVAGVGRGAHGLLRPGLPRVRRDPPGAATKPTVYPDLPHPPSWYVKQQCHATFQVDNIGMRNVPFSGDTSLMWGHDYPHEEGTFPHSRKLVDEQAAHVSPELARRIFRENALEVFKFDRALIDQPF